VAKRDNVKRPQFPGQHQNEEILAVVRQFPLVLRRPLIWGLVIILVSLLPWTVAYSNGYKWLNLAVGWTIIGLTFLAIYWLINWIGWYYSVYVLTSHRIIIIRQRGLFDRQVSELTLNNIQNVNYHIKGFLAAVFKFGDITIETLSGGGDLKLKTIRHPAYLQQKILDTAHKFNSTELAK